MAKQLIAQGYSNKAAAAELKFSSESHFCREFKKVFGTSPQTFAPAHRNFSRSPNSHSISKNSWNALRSTVSGEH
jgi:AraC-like DNA-binding protein